MTGSRDRQGYGAITAAFGITALAGAGFAVVYALDAGVRLQGLTLLVAFGSLAIGFGLWSRRHMPEGMFVEEHPVTVSSPDERRALYSAVDRAHAPLITTPWPRRMLLTGLGTLGAALLFPIRSMFTGPEPNSSLSSTPWRAGALVVREDGSPVRPGDLDVDSMLTVYPEGYTHAGDTAVALVRLRPEQLALDAAALAGTVNGVVAYSKLCTHAGCPVGQFVPTTAQLMCPCHQSLFDVPDGAVPVAGPAARPLPQLPIGVDDAGMLIALDGFSEPVGPGYWTTT
ncbi:QcrA and Rieske domain-containing protein [Phytoactinopolyspora halotolerans]|uniref:Cytochrome bc1 complex Rieske iron-sulfur subunit n=1 Tax=Phytoactinopolyspora halotolerans TaxID=1981512 RepID=A0A6L9SBX0_9ACTN|nr:Rieske (2Fe-2S) protein [Phytoactinopolyspora halotolerans]NEE02028.1 Rieske 2Fe-2S domain-containing protein [Phytoactinopolyspora halotolerans]